MMNWLPFNCCPRIMGQHLRPDRYIATDEAQLKGKQASEKEAHNGKVKKMKVAQFCRLRASPSNYENQSLYASVHWRRHTSFDLRVCPISMTGGIDYLTQKTLLVSYFSSFYFLRNIHIIIPICEDNFLCKCSPSQAWTMPLEEMDYVIKVTHFLPTY